MKCTKFSRVHTHVQMGKYLHLPTTLSRYLRNIESGIRSGIELRHATSAALLKRRLATTEIRITDSSDFLIRRVQVCYW